MCSYIYSNRLTKVTHVVDCEMSFMTMHFILWPCSEILFFFYWWGLFSLSVDSADKEKMSDNKMLDHDFLFINRIISVSYMTGENLYIYDLTSHNTFNCLHGS